MNERIKKLAEQADDYADAMDYTGKNYIGLRDNYFAELIVQECINLLEFHGFNDAVPYIKWMATNEFGVKE